MKRREQGFTLLEVIVAVSVASLLASLVYGAVRVGQRSADAVDHLAEEAEIKRIGWTFLHRAIENIRAVRDPEDRRDQTGLVAETDRLSFIADMPGYVGPGGLARITLLRDQDRDGARLLLRYARYDPRTNSGSAEENQLQAVLVEDLETVEFAYFGITGEFSEPDWRPHWDESHRLPNLIRIKVRPAGASAWPEIIASPVSDSGQVDIDTDDPGALAEPPEEETDPAETGRQAVDR